jgi:hypothetical protein
MAPPDSVRLDGITYERGAHGQQGKIPAASVDRGAPLGTVEYEEESYELRDGQATDLRAGTRLYAARGYHPSFRLAAREGGGDGRWEFYEVRENPGAEDAADLLDVRGKVERVAIEASGSAREVSSAEEANPALGSEEAERIVDAALGAPLRRVSGARFDRRIVFHLEDGTRSVRTYDPRSGELYLGEYPGEDAASYTGVVLPRDVRASLRPAPRGGG